VRRHRRQLQEGSARVQQALHALARQQLAARQMLGPGGFATALGRLQQLGAQVVDLRLHGVCIVDEGLRTRVDPGFDDGHCNS